MAGKSKSRGVTKAQKKATRGGGKRGGANKAQKQSIRGGGGKKY